MHKYFEDRKARYDAKARDPKLPRPRSPRNTQEKEWVRQEDEMQEMVLRTRPVQQPVVSSIKNIAFRVQLKISPGTGWNATEDCKFPSYLCLAHSTYGFLCRISTRRIFSHSYSQVHDLAPSCMCFSPLLCFISRQAVPHYQNSLHAPTSITCPHPYATNQFQRYHYYSTNT